MNTNEKFKLITQGLEEILTEQDLKKLLEKKVSLRHYIGFEISGKIHLGTGLATSLVIKNLQKSGVKCAIFLADWHTFLNEKLGGADFATIQRVAVGYFKEGLTAALRCVSAKPEKVKFILGSDLYHHNDEYWQKVVEISKNITLSRVMRSLSILGREAKMEIDFAKLIYPPMQIADIFAQRINLAHGGMDQRKAHVIMRGVALKIDKPPKPVAIHNHLILGLGKPPVWPVSKEKLRDTWTAMKMSKSKPDTCVFIHDAPEQIHAKIKKAFCPPPRGRSPLRRGEGPPQETEFNPILDWTKHLIFPIKKELAISRKKEHGGNLVYKDFGDLQENYKAGKLHPEDLKNAVAKSIIGILEPARKHFSSGKPKKMLKELEELMPG